MAESGVHGDDFLKFIAEDSGNVDPSGMFSIQVLSKALEMFGLSAVPLNSPEASMAKAEPHTQSAFLCNLEEHWFSVRTVGANAQWWNFNSMFTGPRPLSTFYLSAFLDSLREQGYTIFVIKGQMPRSDPEMGAAGGSGQWLLASEARKRAKQSQAFNNAASTQSAAQKRGSTMYDLTGDDDLQRALAESLGGIDGGGMGQNEDADLAAAIAASLQDHAARPTTTDKGSEAGVEPAEGDGSKGVTVAAAGGLDDGAPAMARSKLDLPQLDDEPPAGDNVAEIVLRLPSGERRSRRFALGNTVGHVAAFAAAAGVDMALHQLATAFPRRVLRQLESTLEESELKGRQLLHVEHV